jgi:hypothetical protein
LTAKTIAHHCIALLNGFFSIGWLAVNIAQRGTGIVRDRPKLPRRDDASLSVSLLWDGFILG